MAKSDNIPGKICFFYTDALGKCMNLVLLTLYPICICLVKFQNYYRVKNSNIKYAGMGSKTIVDGYIA